MILRDFSKNVKIWVTSIITFLTLMSIPLALGATELDYTPRELIVKTSQPAQIRGLSLDIPELDVFFTEVSIKEIKKITPSNEYFVVRLEDEFEWNNLRRRNSFRELRLSGKVEYIQPNYLNKMLVNPNDPLFSEQVLDIIKVPQAWNYETGSEQVIVAIVDSGLHFDHPEFADYSNIWINEAENPPDGNDSSGNGYVDDWRGWDFVDAPELGDIALGDYIDQDNEPFDETGHGTHIAGIIGAKTNNNEGIAGVCWDVKMMILRAGFRTTTGAGYLQDDDVSAAIIYAVDNGAHIISISWGSFTYSQIIADACQYAYDKGVIIVASAGNTPGPEVMYPAKLNTTIAVGAVDNNLNLAGFSSFGPDVDIVAPGQNILSTYIPQNEVYYQNLSGTSMSAPFVSAAAALLLSKEPGLDFNRVTSRLYSSAKDLGESGFDNFFGHGLLDVEQMLNNFSSSYINVTYPLDHQAMSSSFDIIGSLIEPDLFRYTVMYTGETNPAEQDWKDVEPNLNKPTYYYNEVEDGKIAAFDVPYTFKDGEYLVRIRLSTTSAQTYEKRFRVKINQSVPQLREDQLYATKRYEGVIPNYYVTALFDQIVSLQMDIDFENGVKTSVYSNYADSLHILRIPDSIPEGMISLQLTATNNSGQSFQSEVFPNFVRIDKKAVATDMFIGKPIGDPLISLGKSYDFDQNSVPEFVGMKVKNGEAIGNAGIFEINQNLEIVQKHSFDRSFVPLDLGNTNDSGIEVMGLELDKGIVFETFGAENFYPNIALWSVNDIVGGNFSDWNNNGIDDLLVIRNHQNDRVISIYNREENNYIEVNRLYNTTPTFQRNNFSPRVATADLNRNGYMNVLAADTDGDIMVYEVYGAEQDSLIFHYRLPVPDAYHLSIADFTGDGNLEFCVGGYSYVYTDPNKVFWHFEFFGFEENANSDNRTPGNRLGRFKTLGYVCFDHFESVNSIRAIDMLGSGKSDLVVALTPHLYIISFQDNEFKPIWKGSANTTYQVVDIPENLFTPQGVVVNDYDDEELKSYFVTYAGFEGPPTPRGLIATPINESTVELKWNSSDADYYLVYRKRDDEAETCLDSVLTNSYKDVDLEQGVEYQYAVKAFDNAFTPAVSNYSLWVSAIPYAVPRITEIKMVNRNTLIITFDVQLSNEAINLGYYYVNNNIGRPSSVVHTDNHKAVLLRFSNQFTEPEEPYTIEINGLSGRSGVAYPHCVYPFEWHHDTEPPFIDSYRITSANELNICFDKPIDSFKAENIDNYELNLPLIDPFNEILNVTCVDSTVTILFSDELKISNQAYFLKMNEIEDIWGNKLPNNQNILKFRVIDLDNLDYVQVAPNPFIRGQAGHDHIQFIGLPLNREGQIYFFSLAGELIHKESIPQLTESQNIWRWNGMNKSNNKIASGAYFYVVKMGDDIKRGQLIIVN